MSTAGDRAKRWLAHYAVGTRRCGGESEVF